MSLSMEEVAKALLSEKQQVHQLYEEKIKHGWKVLIVAVSLPVSAATLRVSEIGPIDPQYIMLASCLIGNTVFAYAMWVYREVYAYQRYVESLERHYNEISGKEIMAWESDFNPYHSNQVAVGLTFSALLVCLIVITVLSIAFSAQAFSSNSDQKLVSYAAVFLTALGCLGPFVSVVLVVKDISPPAHKYIRAAVDFLASKLRS